MVVEHEGGVEGLIQIIRARRQSEDGAEHSPPHPTAGLVHQGLSEDFGCPAEVQLGKCGGYRYP